MTRSAQADAFGEMVVQRIADIAEISGLPCGTTVGDRCGGRSFSDNVAVALERRSFHGWLDVQGWTLIVIDR